MSGDVRNRDLIDRPGALVKSLLASFGQRRNVTAGLPIVASWESTIRRSPSAQLDLNGQLFLGFWPDDARSRRTKDGMPPQRKQRSLLTMATNSYLGTSGWVILGPGVQTRVGSNARMSIGEGTYINANTKIHCEEHIEIGHDCAISYDVFIMDNDSHALYVGGKERPSTLPVHIGNRVWIGTRAMILKGVTIGDGAIVAAGSIVSKDVPPKTMVAGVPAKIVRDDVEWY
jgi:acetyltransferase-like isoleucine patch superfamily enzyme